MGTQCSTNIKQQFELIRQQDHSCLGPIKLIRSSRAHTFNSQSHPSSTSRTHITHKLNTNTNMNMQSNFNNNNNNNLYSNSQQQHTFQVNGQQSIQVENLVRNGEVVGVKNISFSTIRQRDKYIKYAKQANAYSRIPTLLRVFGFDTSQSKTWNGSSANTDYRCGTFYSINLYFPYFPQTLRQILTQKHNKIKKLQIPSSSQKPPLLSLPTPIKLNNYMAIDRLPHNQRNLINLYYQQIQILRLIDYIVGALYFLNHLQHKHQAVCPENILVDQQGKFALIDAVVFQLETNYQIGIQQVFKKIGSKVVDGRKYEKKVGSKRDGLKYLSPELLHHVKTQDMIHRQNSQKAEVFSVGLIALQMCLIDYNILQPTNIQSNFPHSPYQNRLPHILDRQSLKLSKPGITKCLIQVQSRYSLQLADLLTLMLEYDPIKRINFSTLIDLLSPLLMKNLTEIQSLYGVNNMNVSMNRNNSQQQKQHSEYQSASQQQDSSQYKNNNINNNSMTHKYVNINTNNNNNHNIYTHANTNPHINNINTNPNPNPNINTNMNMNMNKDKNRNQNNQISQRLVNKLTQLQQSYQNIMNKSVLLSYQYQYPHNQLSNINIDQHYNSNSKSINNNNNNNKSNSNSNSNSLPDKQQIIQDEKRILKQLRKINLISKHKNYNNLNNLSSTSSKNNNNSNINNGNNTNVNNGHANINVNVHVNNSNNSHNNSNSNNKQGYRKIGKFPQNYSNINQTKTHINPNINPNTNPQTHTHTNMYTNNNNNNNNIIINSNDNKREVKGIELYDLYLNEYQSIKKNRFR